MRRGYLRWRLQALEVRRSFWSVVFRVLGPWRSSALRGYELPGRLGCTVVIGCLVENRSDALESARVVAF